MTSVVIYYDGTALLYCWNSQTDDSLLWSWAVTHRADLPVVVKPRVIYLRPCVCLCRWKVIHNRLIDVKFLFIGD